MNIFTFINMNMKAFNNAFSAMHFHDISFLFSNWLVRVVVIMFTDYLLNISKHTLSVYGVELIDRLVNESGSLLTVYKCFLDVCSVYNGQSNNEERQFPANLDKAHSSCTMLFSTSTSTHCTLLGIGPWSGGGQPEPLRFWDDLSIGK